MTESNRGTREAVAKRHAPSGGLLTAVPYLAVNVGQQQKTALTVFQGMCVWPCGAVLTVVLVLVTATARHAWSVCVCSKLCCQKLGFFRFGQLCNATCRNVVLLQGQVYAVQS